MDDFNLPDGQQLDPEAAFQLAHRLVQGNDRPERAERLFDIAARALGPQTLWRVADIYVSAFDTRAVAWMRRAAASLDNPDGIAVDPGTLPIIMWGEHMGHQDWEIAVRGGDHLRAVAGLQAAKDRLRRITDDGRELTEQEWKQALATAVDFYSPNNVTIYEERPSVVLNCKDAIMPLMAGTAIKVVIDELQRAGLERAQLFTPART